MEKGNYSNSTICLVKAAAYDYPGKEELFRPASDYPELRQLDLGTAQGPNAVYEAVREGFRLMGLDAENYGTEQWNPLRDIVCPGDNVLIKPNLVLDRNRLEVEGVECLYTQPGVVAPVIDYVILAQRGKGTILVADAPVQSCHFDHLIEDSGYKDLIAMYKAHSIDITLLDLRELTSVTKGGVQYTTLNKEAKGRIIDLGIQSEFVAATESEIKRMRVTNYDPRIMNTHHDQVKHEYYVAQQMLDADVIINMPKPKSHRKAGMTGALKNMVGINTRKEFLPHHTVGAVAEQGDEYEKKNLPHRLASFLIDRANVLAAEKKYGSAKAAAFAGRLCGVAARLTGSTYAEGSWWGNRTISRTVADLNKIVFYADRDGIMQDEPVRRMLIVADMIVAGEKEGPLEPSAKKTGYIAVGRDPVCFDEGIASFMGFDPEKIPSIGCAKAVSGTYQLTDGKKIQIASNVVELNGITADSIPQALTLAIEPTSGWKGYIERDMIQ